MVTAKTTPSKTKEAKKVSSKELEELIGRALKKIDGVKENDICRYLPMQGGYMHHFTLRKMKTEVPEELSQMINRFIMETEQPATVPPKPRAARGSRKRGDQIVLNDGDFKRLLNIARLANDQEMIRKLTPKKSLPGIKRDLIGSIRQGKVNHDLWNSYVEAINSQMVDLQKETPEAPNTWKDLPGMQ